MRLHFAPGACALGVQIALREAGMKFDMLKVDIKNKTYEGGDYRALNPKGYIPAVETDDGQLLTEGAVILQWIADQVPDKELLPRWGGADRYRAMEWLNYVSTELHKGMAPLLGRQYNDEAKAVIREKLATRFEYVNKHLEGKVFFLGEKFSMVDAYAFNMFRWAAALRLDMSAYPHILAWNERMTMRESVRESVAAESAAKTRI